MGDHLGDPLDALRDATLAEMQARFLPIDFHEDDAGGLPGGPRPRFDPPEPDPGCDPRLAAAWRGLFWGAPANDAIASDHDPQTQHRFRAALNGGGAGLGRSRQERSPNWSGAVLAPGGGMRFSAVAARWRVPRATRPADDRGATPRLELPAHKPLLADEAGPRLPESWRCSIWVGLDGHRAMSDSLPQIGTTVVVDTDAAGQERVRAHAWAQWWVRGKQYGELRFVDFDLRPDDTVTAFVMLRSPHRAVLRIRNERTGRIGTASWRSGAPREEDEAFDPRRQQIHAPADAAPAEGAAAAFVVERPMVMFSRELYPLPAFEPVAFDSCIAALQAPGAPFARAAALLDLRAARLIGMHHARANPYRSETCAVPARPATDRLTLRHKPAGMAAG